MATAKNELLWANAWKDSPALVSQVDAVLEKDDLRVVGSHLEEIGLAWDDRERPVLDDIREWIVARTVQREGAEPPPVRSRPTRALADEASASGNRDLDRDVGKPTAGVLVTTSLVHRKGGEGSQLLLTTLALPATRAKKFTAFRKVLFDGAPATLAPKPEDDILSMFAGNTQVQAMFKQFEHAMSRKLQSDWQLYTAVSVDGKPLTEQELSAAGDRVKRRVTTARGLQMLAAVKAAAEKQWAKGVLVLGESALAVVDERIGSLEWTPLMEEVQCALDGGPNPTIAESRYRRAVRYEKAGLFLEAAALYKRNIDDDAANPGKVIQPGLPPCMVWCYYGIALNRAQDRAGAIAAFRSALDCYDSGGDGGTRKTIGERYYRGLRLYILDRLLVMFNNRPQHREDFARTMREVFREQIAVVKAESTGGEEEQFEFFGDYEQCRMMKCRRSGRRFVLRTPDTNPATHEIVELKRNDPSPPRVPFERAATLPAEVCAQIYNMIYQEQAAGDADRMGDAAKPLAAAAAAAPAPARAPKCAACGTAEAPGVKLKFCSLCKEAWYCGAAWCQRRDWDAGHKKACKGKQKNGKS